MKRVINGLTHNTDTQDNAMRERENASRCDKCGETVADIDAGFSPGCHQMRHECGGTWRRVMWDRE